MKKRGLFGLKKECSLADCMMSQLLAVAATLVILKASVPYSMEWLFNTSAWWFIGAFIVIVLVIIIKGRGEIAEAFSKMKGWAKKKL